MAALLGIDLGTSAVKAVVIDEDRPSAGHGDEGDPHGGARAAPCRAGPGDLVVEHGHGRAGGAPRSGRPRGLGHRPRRAHARRASCSMPRIGRWARPSRGPTSAAQRSSPRSRSAVGIADLPARRAARVRRQASWHRRWPGCSATTQGSFEAAAVCILPKDYLRLRLTGLVASDVSDASATALFDITARRWSAELCWTLGLPEALLPELLESADVAGPLTRAAADELGLAAGMPVVAGSADQPAQAVANGLPRSRRRVGHAGDRRPDHLRH